MIYLVDASVYVFRAYYSIPETMTDPEGRQVNALYGFARFLGDLIETDRPAVMAVAFDESLTTSFRNDIYPAYKANREPAPPELKRQFELCRRLTRAMGIAELADPSYEADDIIGSLAVRMRSEGMSSVIVTRDKDLAQVLRPGDVFWDYSGKRRLAYEEIHGEFGVHPEQIADFLALTGDSVDNIPGVPGVGKKTAASLLGHFADLDEIYARLEEVPGLPIRGAARLSERLAEHRDAAYLARRLTRIFDAMPFDGETLNLERRDPDLDRLDDLYGSAGFGGAIRAQAKRIAGEGARG